MTVHRRFHPVIVAHRYQSLPVVILSVVAVIAVPRAVWP
jgi:hypothetical protein